MHLRLAPLRRGLDFRFTLRMVLIFNVSNRGFVATVNIKSICVDFRASGSDDSCVVFIRMPILARHQSFCFTAFSLAALMLNRTCVNPHDEEHEDRFELVVSLEPRETTSIVQSANLSSRIVCFRWPSCHTEPICACECFCRTVVIRSNAKAAFLNPAFLGGDTSRKCHES